jgi:hypothetical protein
MTEAEAIRRAREFAELEGYLLDEEGVAVLLDSLQNETTPVERIGWWNVHFHGWALCGGHPPRQSFWVNDTTGQVEWFNLPKPRTLIQAFRRRWFGELTRP